ncbi:phosphotransferase family protein [Streptomyces albireticuli]|uniref:Aminoglycoside phosphotransferase n=1 Tax=Streptomyces albireticuli TaxID=1940 RepID=A0A2A2D6C2_9ACTN|nr:phosphotransferase [Streptomyces albireticuli]MCD9145992.1 phosphotransferase [Streptomyces albireticuli]MCD9165754.1 phosphotransferase [Streptomyces albireticuli]MCD9195972.1 phosphotransferase [Streptomyces albireticuli]PAU46929.1 aminoglycoside phosphotransferase [Streptomyces albireticuli]
MAEGESAAVVETDIDDLGGSRTRVWVERSLRSGDRVCAVAALRGGWTSQMRRLDVEGEGEPYSLVLRSFVKPFFVRHALGLLTREADILRLLADTNVPAARLHGVDAAAEHCDHPSLLMSLLPGSLRLDGEDIERKTELLARQLVAIHGVLVPEGARPRTYQAWTSPERVRLPENAKQPEVWQRAVEVIRQPPPAYRPCFLHRDFHPGNVLFAGEGADLTITGVVDWVETSWGPADLDVAHCSTALALLHGVPVGMRLADHYVAAGGTLSDDPADHLYWRVLDALAFAPDAEKVAEPWREIGREDLTPAVLAQRLEEYLQALFSQYG